MCTHTKYVISRQKNNNSMDYKYGETANISALNSTYWSSITTFCPDFWTSGYRQNVFKFIKL